MSTVHHDFARAEPDTTVLVAQLSQQARECDMWAFFDGFSLDMSEPFRFIDSCVWRRAARERRRLTRRRRAVACGGSAEWPPR